MQETAHSGAKLFLSGEVSSFLNYCRVEKGLSSNTLEAYTRDLKALSDSQKPENGLPGLEDLRHYLDSLYKDGSDRARSPGIWRLCVIFTVFWRRTAESSPTPPNAWSRQNSGNLFLSS